jgi:hypothetical protein
LWRAGSMLGLHQVARITAVYLLSVVCFLVPGVDPVPITADEMEPGLLTAVVTPLDSSKSLLQESVALKAPSSSAGFPSWALAPIILGGFVLLAATFVGVRWIQFKQRRNQSKKKLPTQQRIIDARVAGLTKKGMGGSLSLIPGVTKPVVKDLIPKEEQKGQDFAKLGHGHIPDYGHVFEEKSFPRASTTKCRVCGQFVVGANVQCSRMSVVPYYGLPPNPTLLFSPVCRGSSHAHCLGGINFQCKPGEADTSYLIEAEEEEEPDLPEDEIRLKQMYDELLVQLNIPQERHASMQALPLEHKKTLLRQQIKQTRKSVVQLPSFPES